MCHPERSLSQSHRERRSRSTCGCLCSCSCSCRCRCRCPCPCPCPCKPSKTQQKLMSSPQISNSMKTQQINLIKFAYEFHPIRYNSTRDQKKTPGHSRGFPH